jgi:hypothetical protein
MNNKLLLCVVSSSMLFAAAASADPKQDVIAAFFRVDQAIVNGDLDAAKTAASELAQKAQAADRQAILKDANDLAKSDTIDQGRQLYKALAEDALALIKTGESSQNTASATCPMMGSRNTASTSCSMMGSQTAASLNCPMVANQNAASPTCSTMMDMTRRCSSM